MKKCNSTVINAFREFFKNVPIGKEFETKEIKRMISVQYGIKEGSIIPSDCSYNMTNKGMKNTSFEKFNIFIQIKHGLYRYVGENFCEETE